MSLVLVLCQSKSILIQYHIFAEYNSALLSSIKVLPISFGLVLPVLLFRKDSEVCYN